MFALVDGNNFYVSCERVFQPRLEGKPVVVMSNNDGCAVSRSNEAKALGIKMAQPMFLSKDLIKAHKIVCLSSNYTLYGDMSRRVVQTLNQFTPDVEQYSIDESFLGFLESNPLKLSALGLEVRTKVKRATGIPTCIGFGPTKTLAKIANKLAKKLPNGVLVIDTKQNYRELLAKVAVEEVWGVGRQYAEWLTDHGIHTALDLHNAPEALIRKKMTVVGQRLVQELRGISCLPLELIPPVKKEICFARSFGKLLESKEEILQAISNYAFQASTKLRSNHLITSKCIVFIETNGFRVNDPQYQRSISFSFQVPTNHAPSLIQGAVKAMESIYRVGYKFKKAGILCLDLVDENTVQQSLFEQPDHFAERRLMAAMDSVNQKYGRFAMTLAGGFISKEWRPKFESKTHRWTTCWEELPKAIA